MTDQALSEIHPLRVLMRSTGHDLMQPVQIVSHALERLALVVMTDRDRMWLDAASIQLDRISSGLSGLVAATTHTEKALQRDRIDLGLLFSEIGVDWGAAASAAGSRLIIVPSTAFVISDRKRLRSMLDNLVGNAIKYNASGKILLGCRRRGSDLAIEVIDDGPGISEPDQKRIFEAFCQIDPARQGVGLGLSLVHADSVALGHQIELASIPGRGSRFSVIVEPGHRPIGGTASADPRCAVARGSQALAMHRDPR